MNSSGLVKVEMINFIAVPTCYIIPFFSSPTEHNINGHIHPAGKMTGKQYKNSARPPENTRRCNKTKCP